jgi:hypothetical protein
MSVASNFYDTTVTFPCCNNTWTTQHEPLQYGSVHTPTTDDPPLTPEIRAGLKKVKKAIAAKNKGFTLAKAAIKTAHDAFKAQSAPLIASLKAMKQEALLAAKLTEGFREGVRSYRAASTIETLFRKQFNIHSLSSYGIRIRRYRWRWSTPQCVLNQKFRIRL